jgi:hypothetical protein
MKKQHTLVNTTLATLGLFLSASSMADSPFDDNASASSIEACVAQVSTQANYEDAVGVRHEVETQQRRTGGHRLHIDTKVFGDSDGQVIREYAATCIIGRDGTPVSLRIKQVNTEA